MTNDKLQAIEERWKKATPGNWGWIIRGNSAQSHAVVCHDDAKSLMPQNICSGISPKTGNAEAIAHAPTDIAALLAEVRRLNQSNKARECCGNCKNHKYNQRFGLSCPVHGDRIHPSNWCELWVSGKESEVADK